MINRVSTDSTNVLEQPSIDHKSPDVNGPAGGLGRIFQSLRNRDFLFLWLGMLGSLTAMGMQMVANGYLAYELSGSASGLGVVTAAWGIPQLLLSPLGGVVADRFSKRNLMLTTQSVLGVMTLINVFLIMTGLIQIWHMVALGLVQGAVFAFNMPARQAIIPLIVGRENIANAIALNNAGMNLTRIVGPAIAGLIIAMPGIGIAGAYGIMALCYVVALLMLLQLPSQQGNTKVRHGSVMQEMLNGAHYVADHSRLRLLLVGAFAFVLFAMPYQILMPVFALRVHGVGPEGLGLLAGTSGVGALIGSMIVAYFSASPNKGALQTLAGIGVGIFLVMFAFAPTYALAAAMMLMVGAAGNMYMALNSTMIMTSTDASMHGRVMSIYMMTFSLMPLTALPMGLLADTIGVQWTVAIGGAFAALAIAGIGLFSKLKMSEINAQ